VAGSEKPLTTVPTGLGEVLPPPKDQMNRLAPSPPVKVTISNFILPAPDLIWRVLMPSVSSLNSVVCHRVPAFQSKVGVTPVTKDSGVLRSGTTPYYCAAFGRSSVSRDRPHPM